MYNQNMSSKGRLEFEESVDHNNIEPYCIDGSWDKFEGHFLEGLPDGLGVLHFKNGERYHG
jgi:hypothetical protein